MNKRALVQKQQRQPYHSFHRFPKRPHSQLCPPQSAAIKWLLLGVRRQTANGMPQSPFGSGNSPHTNQPLSGPVSPTTTHPTSRCLGRATREQHPQVAAVWAGPQTAHVKNLGRAPNSPQNERPNPPTKMTSPKTANATSPRITPSSSRGLGRAPHRQRNQRPE